jgi:2-polyprenyl-3-methyl-5-hydroxy-6-metoxy-1,4-benzoquinol methylase
MKKNEDIRKKSVMTKFDLSRLLMKSKPIDSKIEYILKECKNRKVLDLGCIRHSADFALNDPNWLHKKIIDVADHVVGVDYLSDEIEILQKYGFNIMYGDVTLPLNIESKFDIIVAGDLIEHLTNFDGFFKNCQNLLEQNGKIIITTPNPFFIDEFFYVALKRNFLINPEHTCWIDPQSLLQLISRFNFRIEHVAFIKHSWELKNLIPENKSMEYDILNGKWLNDTYTRKIYRMLLGFIFNMIFVPFKVIFGLNTKLVKYSDYIFLITRNNEK